jgi:hypothetical protein
MPVDHRHLYRTVLVVARDPAASAALAAELGDLGCFVGGPFTTTADAQRWLSDHCADVALVDARLVDRTSPLMRALADDGIAVLRLLVRRLRTGRARAVAVDDASVAVTAPLADLLDAALLGAARVGVSAGAPRRLVRREPVWHAA